MKNPDEIKMGLECCLTGNCKGCNYRPLYGVFRCKTERTKDALAYIQQLEKRIAHLEALNQQDLSVITMQERTRARLEEQISQLESSIPRWISVEERLPGERGNYLVRCYFHIPGSTYTYENIKIIHFRGKTKWATENEYITYWMPLPEPPKEE